MKLLETDPAERLIRLLEKERAALLEADFTVLAAIAPRKERLAERLAERAGGAPPPAEVAARLHEAARRNAALLEAAEAGLRRAADRLGAANGAQPEVPGAGAAMPAPAPRMLGYMPDGSTRPAPARSGVTRRA